MKQQKANPPYALKIVLDSVGYAGYGMGGLFFLVLLLPFSVFLYFSSRLRNKILHRVLRYYCFFLTRIYLPLLQIYRVRKIRGRRRACRHQPAIFISNHRGRLDGPLLLGIIPNAGVIIKSKYADQPVYSSFVKHLDFVSVDPQSLESLGKALDQCRKLLSNGKNLLIFPEGTRAASGKLLPFKDFAFRLAREMNITVIPIVIHSDLPFMAKIKGSHFPRRRFDYYVRFLDPQKCRDDETAADFSMRIRQMMAEHLKELDKGTVWNGNAERSA